MKNLFRKITALVMTLCMIVGMAGLFATAYAEGLDDAAIVAADKDALAVGFVEGDSADGVTDDLTLPLTGVSGSAITWLSDAPEVIADDGAVTRPAAGAEDAEVTLTATITHGEASGAKEFTVTVLKESEPQMLFAPLSVTWVGDGSPGGPYQVSSAEHLAWITANSLTAHYIQTANINISGEGFTNWTPIAPYATNPFTGSYDGNGYTISNLFSNSARDLAGLFGNIGSGGRLENITLTNADVFSSTSGGRIGALVGHNLGNISGCSSSGSVSGGWADIGGLVGTNDGTIEDSSSSAAVSGAKAGGLVGGNNRTIRRSTSSGHVSGGDNAWAGGLAGYFMPQPLPGAVIEDCHSTGDVTGGADASVGGLVGMRMTDLMHGTNILNSSSSGNITGGTNAKLGGLVAEDIMIPIALNSITIFSTDHKTTYSVGEPLNMTGLVVTGSYDGGNTAVVEPFCRCVIQICNLTF